MADALALYSDDEVIEMSTSDARQALHALSIKVLVAGSREGRDGPRPGQIPCGTGAVCQGAHAVHVAQS